MDVDRLRRASPWLAVALFPAFAWLWLRLNDRDALYLASFDDVFRIQHAWEAAHGAVFPSELWPPLPFWLTAPLFRLWTDGRVVPPLLGVLASTATLGMLVVLARQVGLGRAGQLAAVAAAAVLPWFLYLAPSALAEPYAHLALLVALVGVLRAEDGDARGIPLAAGALALGGMCRYEVWGSAALFVAWGVRRAPTRPSNGWLAAPFVFPAAWVLLQTAWTGHPFQFGEAAIVALAEDDLDAGSRWFGIPLDALAALGPVLPLALVGGWRLWQEPRGRRVVGYGLAVLAMMLLADVFNLAGIHNRPRHFVLPALVAALCAGAAVDALAVRAGALAAGGVGVVLVQALVGSWDTPPDGVEDHVSVLGQRVRSAWRAREVPAGSLLLVEAVPFESVAFQIAGGDMARVTFDREPWKVPTGRTETKAERAANPSVFDAPWREVMADLAERHVGMLLLHDPQLVERASTFGRIVDFQGGWVLVRVDG